MSKYSKIIIQPQDYTGALMAQQVAIIEEFKANGCLKRGDFINTVLHHSDSWQSYQDLKNLEAYWSYRYKSQEYNTRLEAVLEKITDLCRAI